MVQGVVFDMDGLMFDTESLGMIAWGEQAAQRGFRFTDEVGKMIRGRNDAGIREVLCSYYGEALDYEDLRNGVRRQMKEHIAKEGVPMKKGLAELLHWLNSSGIPCAVASSSRLETVMERCRDAHIETLFKAVICGDMVVHSKPDPEIFLRAAKEIGAEPEHCIVLEDSFNGVRAGNAGGFITIMVPDLDQPTPEIDALYTSKAESLCEVLERLKQGEWN